MQQTIHLKSLLARTDDPKEQNATFALFGLGITEFLSSGARSADEALCEFFHAKNCLFVRQTLHSRPADEFMSRGVQLADLFDVLPTRIAQREYQRELAMMRALCLGLLENERNLQRFEVMGADF